LPTRGEDLPAWARRVRGTAVLHPSVLMQEQARRNDARQRAKQRVRDAMRWMAGSLAALLVFAVLQQTAGLSVWLVVANVAAVAASVAITLRARQMTRPAALDAAMPPRALRQGQVVRLDQLDDRDKELLKRGRQALDDIFSSHDDYGNPSARLGDGTIDRDQAEWTLAEMLRDLTRVRARYDADPATDPGAAARRDLEAAQETAEAFVRDFEETAVQSVATNFANRRYAGKERARVSGEEGLAATALMRARADSVLEQFRAYRKGLAELQQKFEDMTDEDPQPPDEE